MSKNSVKTATLVKKPRKPGSLISKIRRDIGAWILLIPALFCIYFFMLRPQVMGVYWSFFDMKGFDPQEFVGFENYRRVLARTDFIATAWNTLKYVGYSLLIGFPLPFFIALVMNELIHYRKLTRMLVYLPGIIPVVATSMLWVFVYNPSASGLLNTLLGKIGMEPYEWLQDSKLTILWIIVSMTWSGAGGTSLYYFAAMQGINRELYEAAVIDGAGYFRRVKIVTLPYLYGMLILFGVKQIIGVFNTMEQVLQMTDGGPNNASMTLGVLNYRYAFKDAKPQFALALGVLMFIVLTIFAVIYFKLNKKIEENQL